MAAIKTNSAFQSFSNNADGFDIAGGTTARKLTVTAGDIAMAGGGTYVHSLPLETCMLGKQRRHGNSSFMDSNMIWGKASMAHGTYTGNATGRDIACGFFPHFFCTKAITAVQGVMWNYWGLCKGTNEAGTSGNVTRITDDGLGVRLGTTAGANTNAAGYNYMALCAQTGLTGMKCKVGTYTGNGSDNRDITGVGFQADVLIIKSAGANAAVWRVDQAGDSTGAFLINTADNANWIQSLGADGFQLGSADQVNKAATLFTWMAFKSDAAGTSDIAITKYIGCGGDGMHIELPFQPSILFLQPAGALATMFWNSSMAAGNTGYVSVVTADVTDGVIKADAYGFTLGASAILNVANTVVNVVAIKCDL